MGEGLNKREIIYCDGQNPPFFNLVLSVRLFADGVSRLPILQGGPLKTLERLI